MESQQWKLTPSRRCGSGIKRSFLVVLLLLCLICFGKIANAEKVAVDQVVTGVQRMQRLLASPKSDSSLHLTDFTPFRKKIQEVLDATANLPVLTPDHTVLDCAFPKNAIMFTYTSFYTMELVHLQQQAMHTTSIGSCLASRMIVLCFDTKCHSACNDYKIPNCALIESNFPPSDFNQGEYLYFTYIKHELMKEALMVADEIFFFDGDVLLFKNPWIEIQSGRDKDGNHLKDGPYDIMWQRDRGRTSDCSGSVNTGQIYLRNSTAVHKYLDGMRSMKDKILAGNEGLDQDFVANHVFGNNLKYCTLTPHLYTAHCYMVFGNIQFMAFNTQVKQLISYHTSCVGGLQAKKQHMMNVLREVQMNSTKPIKNAL